MCGRFTLRTPAAELVAAFGVAGLAELQPRYNIAPTQEVVALRAGEGGRELAHLRWGLVPSWAKDSSGAARMINARAETVADKPAFRAPFKRRRCLVPADGYYEWEAIGKRKQPHWIHLADGRPFAFAGLWECWRPPGVAGEPPEGALETLTLITTEAPPSIASIHHRMPVIVAPNDYDAWLDPDLQDRDRLLEFLHPWADSELVSRPVSTVVNRATHDRPDCLDPPQGLLF